MTPHEAAVWKLRDETATAIEDDGREAVTGRLEAMHAAFVADGDEDAADVVSDVLDMLTGWCSPAVRL